MAPAIDPYRAGAVVARYAGTTIATRCCQRAQTRLTLPRPTMTANDLSRKEAESTQRLEASVPELPLGFRRSKREMLDIIAAYRGAVAPEAILLALEAAPN